VKTVSGVNISPGLVLCSLLFQAHIARSRLDTRLRRRLPVSSTSSPYWRLQRKAKTNGSTRICMSAAWREMENRKRGFERILEMVREVRKMDMEVCTTLGMLSSSQAKQLKEAYVFYQSR
jgi:hypothetical protein